MRLVVLALVFTACTVAPKGKSGAPSKTTKKGAMKPGMPAGFRVVGKARVEPAFLEPGAAWRALRSRITTLQAEAVSRALDILVTFETGEVHATTRGGSRRTWELPPGVRLGGCPAHVLLGADYSTKLFRRDHSQVATGKEVTIVTARVGIPGQKAREFRLIIQAGRTIRSISTAG